MADDFDPYHVWLGIPPGRRPPTHYQLLAISRDEKTRAVINAAVTRQSAYIRNFQVGKHADDAARILNEIQAAKLCLLDPAKRARYDAQLQQEEPAAPAVSAPQPAGLLFDLEALSGGTATTAPPVRRRGAARPLPRLSKPNKPAPWRAYAAAAAISAAALLIGFSVLGRRHRETVAVKGEQAALDDISSAPPLRQDEAESKSDAAPEEIASSAPSQSAQPASDPDAPSASSGAADAPAPEAAAPAPKPAEAAPKPAEAEAADSAERQEFADLTRKLNDFASWTVLAGQWSPQPRGIRGKGDSSLKFDDELPAEFLLTFRMNVLEGMRPRVYFGAREFWFGNEGFERKLFVYGDGQAGAAGQPRAYANGAALEVACRFAGQDVEFMANGRPVARCRRKTAGPLMLTLSAGDGFSPGQVAFSNFKLSQLRPPAAPSTHSPSAAAAGEAVDLLSRIDLERDVIHGDWKFEGRALTVAAAKMARIELPIVPPDEYVLTAVVEGRPQAKELHVGLIVGGKPAAVRIDGFGGDLTNFGALEKLGAANPTIHRGRVLRDGGPNLIVCTVRRNGVRLECNEQTIFDWSGDTSGFDSWEAWTVHHAGRMFLASFDNACRITKLELTATAPEDWRPVLASPAQVAKAAKRLPKPDGAELRQAARSLDALYDKPLRAAKTRLERWAVIDRMRAQGAATHDDMALRYALLEEARSRAAGMGQIATACEALEELGRSFDLDLLTAKQETIAAAMPKTIGPQLVTGAMIALLTVDRAVAAGRYDVAAELTASIDPATRKLGLPPLVQAVEARRTAVQNRRAAAEQYRMVIERLRSGSEDRRASRDAGLYESLAMGDRKTGLPHLAGADGEFAQIAALAETAEVDVSGRLPLAAAWKAAAEQAPAWKTDCLLQAKYWAGRAAATAAGQNDPAAAALGAELQGVVGLDLARLKPGLRTVLFDGAEFENPRIWRVDPYIDFDAGYGPPAPGAPADNFAVRWTGWLLPPVAGRYVFKTFSDDSVRLRIDGKLVIDRWAKGAGEETAEVELTDGPHHLVVEFNDYQVAARLSLRWSLKDLSTEHLIPTEALFHDPALE